ncbi:MAG: hypothetical protein OEY56_09075, partial [Cyclobacteriaceae bacterium]|nr:hypothetical protein [Cyclobacteriaceae bacterium]
MKSLSEFEAYWKKEIKPGLGQLKKDYEARVPSTGKFWAMVFVPIPLILGFTFLVYYIDTEIYYRDEATTVMHIGLVWLVGWTILLIGVRGLFVASKKRKLFMLEFKRSVFSRCIDFLDTGLSF